MARPNANGGERLIPPRQSLPPAPANPYLGYLPAKYWRYAKDFFVYTANFIPLGAGATTPVDVQINNDSNFFVLDCRIAGYQTDNTTKLTTLPVLMSLKDSSSGRDLQDRSVHVDCYTGTGQLPGFLPYPKLMLGGSVLTVTLQNLDAGNARNYRVSFFGFKIFNFVEA